MFDIFFIAVALSMDASAVCIAIGARHRHLNAKALLRPSLLFGFFQGIMPIIGYVGAASFATFIAQYNRYVALVVLGMLGVKMIFDAFKGEAQEDVSLGYKTLFALAVATSLDALAVGATFVGLGVNVWSGSLIIAAVTAVICLVSVVFGRKLGERFERYAQAIGGFILLLIGLKIFFL